MTTDNRTNEPTPEQIEAAAQAVREVDARAGLIADVDLPMYRARAALVAAAGVAPQAESAPLREALKTAREHFTAIAGSGEIRVWEDTGEKLGIDHQVSVWAKRGERICRDALAAPVQPSSTVDVAALARVVRSALPYDVEVSPVRKSKTERHFRTVADGDLHVERITSAIVEYLTGGTK